jgi:predicted nuclease of predicted toxin-antitoxin system
VSVRLLLDENLSERLVRTLAPRFPDSLHVRTVRMGGASDSDIWNLAVRESCVLVTRDEDFVSLSVVRGPPPKVVWLNVGNTRADAITRLMLGSADAIEGFVAHPDSGFLALGLAEADRG